ncbi:acyltransferase family protein [Algibacter lectus]|uniref:Peptidoglycan/LPS O-acetylase OafA/YrhL n=1 Tax=Algibacter lectus TaxID=221126 RepID=A0A4R8MK49_9FLAO|nr:acyltransferase [Algibacter lectus]MWW24827.1 acyltransferase family protein [Algibacter lectus]TDY64762.1 peptidoglycan/LPS O-acetylase OafA/YrhL [Algibacter lectus]
MKYISGLNGIRAIAVLFVIVSHRFPQDHIVHKLSLGNYGVDIFFVLSGFLISRSLFNKIIAHNNGEISKQKIFKQFFYNRSLRIFPIYYLLLLFMYLTNGIIGNQLKENVLWYLFYGSNYLNYFENKWFGSLAHFWSLAVEEQFYIFWPILLFMFKRRILMFLLVLIIIGTIYPFLISGKSGVLLLSCVNAFSVGALLAYIEINKPIYKNTFIKIIKVVLFPVLIMVLIHQLVVNIPYFSTRLAAAIIAVSIISYCLYHSNSFLVKHILGNKTLNFIGTISYGIYLYHNIVPKYWAWGLRKLNIITPGTHYDFSYLEFFIQTIFIILVSYFSWIIVEKPILKFKDR